MLTLLLWISWQRRDREQEEKKRDEFIDRERKGERGRGLGEGGEGVVGWGQAGPVKKKCKRDKDVVSACVANHGCQNISWMLIT